MSLEKGKNLEKAMDELKSNNIDSRRSQNRRVRAVISNKKRFSRRTNRVRPRIYSFVKKKNK